MSSPNVYAAERRSRSSLADRSMRSSPKNVYNSRMNQTPLYPKSNQLKVPFNADYIQNGVRTKAQMHIPISGNLPPLQGQIKKGKLESQLLEANERAMRNTIGAHTEERFQASNRNNAHAGWVPRKELGGEYAAVPLETGTGRDQRSSELGVYDGTFSTQTMR